MRIRQLENGATPNATRPNYAANNDAIRTHKQSLQRQWMNLTAAVRGGGATAASIQQQFEQNVNMFLDEVSWLLGLNS